MKSVEAWGNMVSTSVHGIACGHSLVEGRGYCWVEWELTEWVSFVEWFCEKRMSVEKVGVRRGLWVMGVLWID